MANTCWSWWISPYVGWPGTSSAVRIVSTPLIFQAALTSMDRIRAYGCGDRRVAPQSMFSAHRSLEKANRPCTLGTPSGRAALVPRPPARSVVAVAVVVVTPVVSRRHGVARCARPATTESTAAKMRP